MIHRNEATQDTTVSRRRALQVSAAAGLSTFVLPSVAMAESSGGEAGGCVWASIPFINQGSSSTVQGVLVTAQLNSAVQGDAPTSYLHQSNERIKTVLIFSPAISNMKVRTRNHADGVSETYSIVWSMGATTVRTDAIVNTDTTKTYVFASPIDTMTVDYTYPTPAGTGAYGSFLDLWLPCQIP